ncbi:glycosyltransferase family 2 protein [Rothia sp. CCM 9418]|uniref:glycosyltransferase family 2 protein n=1 Tax=Rothia sp. CCM 9418 TaxID=3402661 RepID=UPI003AD86401
MNKTTSVSVVIPFYGDPADTMPLIEQLQSQELSIPLEIIVSDDCSPTPFPDLEGVIVIRRELNGGFGKAVNSGIGVAHSDWVFVLNSDLTIGPTFIADMLAQKERHGIGVYSPQVVDHDGKGQWVGRKFPTVFHHAFEWFTPLARFKGTTWWHRLVGHDTRCVTGKTVHTDWVVGACMLLPVAPFRAIGGFDPRFYMNSEEVDLQKRLTENGVPSIFAGEVSAEHVGGGSSESQKRRGWVVDSRFIYAEKWGFKKQLHRSLTAVSYVNFLVNSVRSLRNKDVHARSILSEELSYLEGH